MTKKTKHKVKDQCSWCHNYLRVYTPEVEDLERFEKSPVRFRPRATSKKKAGVNLRGLHFHSVDPIPEKVLKAGNPTLYNWVIKNWGVKGAASLEGDPDWFDEGFADNEEFLEYWFDTPAAPPLAFLKRVSKGWPEFVFLLTYVEWNKCFKGIAKCKSGKMEHYQIKFPEINQERKEVSHAKLV